MRHLLQQKSHLKAVPTPFGCSGHKVLGHSYFPFGFALLFKYGHTNYYPTELKIWSSKHILEDFTLFWLPISLGNKSFQHHSKTKKLSSGLEGMRLNWTTNQHRWSKKNTAKLTVLSPYTVTCLSKSPRLFLLLGMSSKMWSSQAGTEKGGYWKDRARLLTTGHGGRMKNNRYKLKQECFWLHIR